MSSSKPYNKSWREVRRGKQEIQRQSHSASGGRGLQSTQRPTESPSHLASTHLIPSSVQPILQTAPNGRIILPEIPSESQSASKKKKEKIPYEIKNAREWDPDRRESSSESSDEDYYENHDDDYYYESDFDERLQESGDVSGTVTDDGSQRAFSQLSKSSAHPQDQRRGNPKVFPHGRPSDRRRAHPWAKFNFKRDNLARAAFRKRLKPNGSFILPKDCPDIEPNQRRMYDNFDEIGVRLGSFIRPPQHVKDHELLLWGDATQIQNTKDELRRWLEKRLQIDLPRKSIAKDKFARETSSLGDPYQRLMKKMQKEAKVLEFQQAPAEGRVFSYMGTFLWPVDEVRPEDILGPSLEAFDPIRFQYHCHIVFDHKLSSFRIFSDKEDAVKGTMDRLVGTMREYVAKSFRPDKFILVEPPTSSTMRQDVKMLPASFNGPKVGKGMIPVLTGSMLDPKGRSEWLNKRNELMMRNNRRLELSLRKCIANLPHHRGLIRIRVQFGTFALKEYRWRKEADSTPFEEFANDLMESGTKCVMIRDLQVKKDATTIIGMVQQATNLFLPMDISHTSLEEVVPSFSACFEFENSTNSPMTLILELSSSPAAPTIYEKVQELWTRTGRRENAVPLEVFMARLDSGASWKLQVSTENRIDSSRINPKMTEFAESVKLSKIPRTRTELTGQRVFTWNRDLPGTMQPSAFQQKTALRYRLVHQPNWEFEIARYDSYGNPKSENVPVETNWGATLYDTNWDSILTDNSTLDIGEAAKWNPRLATFFPSTPSTADMEGAEGIDPGVMEFLEVVEVVSRFIDSIKKELPHLSG